MIFVLWGGSIIKKINILQKNIDFSRIIHNNKAYIFNDFIIYIERNENNIYKFGISVSKKIGNAVVRNKIKRQVKNIIDKKHYQNSFNCIIIIKKGFLRKSFKEKEKNIFNAFNELNIIKEEYNEKA